MNVDVVNMSFRCLIRPLSYSTRPFSACVLQRAPAGLVQFARAEKKFGVQRVPEFCAASSNKNLVKEIISVIEDHNGSLTLNAKLVINSALRAIVSRTTVDGVDPDLTDLLAFPKITQAIGSVFFDTHVAFEAVHMRAAYILLKEGSADSLKKLSPLILTSLQLCKDVEDITKIYIDLADDFSNCASQLTDLYMFGLISRMLAVTSFSAKELWGLVEKMVPLMVDIMFAEPLVPIEDVYFIANLFMKKHMYHPELFKSMSFALMNIMSHLAGALSDDRRTGFVLFQLLFMLAQGPAELDVFKFTATNFVFDNSSHVDCCNDRYTTAYMAASALAVHNLPIQDHIWDIVCLVFRRRGLPQRSMREHPNPLALNLILTMLPDSSWKMRCIASYCRGRHAAIMQFRKGDLACFPGKVFESVTTPFGILDIVILVNRNTGEFVDSCSTKITEQDLATWKKSTSPVVPIAIMLATDVPLWDPVSNNTTPLVGRYAKHFRSELEAAGFLCLFYHPSTPFDLTSLSFSYNKETKTKGLDLASSFSKKKRKHKSD